MQSSTRNFLVFLIILIALGLWTMTSYNGLVANYQSVQAAWSQVENVYQRRLDLIPNLVNTVKGYAQHEQKTFIEVTQARTNAIQAQQAVKSQDDLGNVQKMQQVDMTQAALSSALGRLMVVVEKYPDLKASQNFLALQAELAGTENRISVERRRFNQDVQRYNQLVATFPTLMMARLFNFLPVNYFQAEVGANKAPVVDFNAPVTK